MRTLKYCLALIALCLLVFGIVNAMPFYGFATDGQLREAAASPLNYRYKYLEANKPRSIRFATEAVQSATVPRESKRALVPFLEDNGAGIPCESLASLIGPEKDRLTQIAVFLMTQRAMQDTDCFQKLRAVSPSCLATSLPDEAISIITNHPEDWAHLQGRLIGKNGTYVMKQ